MSEEMHRLETTKFYMVSELADGITGVQWFPTCDVLCDICQEQRFGGYRIWVYLDEEHTWHRWGATCWYCLASVVAEGGRVFPMSGEF